MWLEPFWMALTIVMSWGPSPFPEEDPVRPPDVNRRMTRRRRGRVVENDEYAAFLRRALRAYARRIGKGDIDEFAQMAAIADEMDDILRQAVAGLRAAGFSWADIAARTGTTRQAAWKRWANPSGNDHEEGLAP
jgi:hypothetical protein